MTDRDIRVITKCGLMAGTVGLALLPLYLTKWQDAIYDGALLVLTLAFASDGVFRCLDPETRTGRFMPMVKTFLGVGAIVVVVAAALQYGPIANDLRKEKQTVHNALERQDIGYLASFEKDREQDEQELPNTSLTLLICGVSAEFGAIIALEKD